MEHGDGSMTDVLVVGGGVIGLSIAWELARNGVSVKLLDQGAFGQEASWAGAGILPPGNPDSATHPYDRLRGESCRLWPKWSAELLELTGIDNGFLDCGGIEIRLAGPTDQLDDLAESWRQEHVTVELLDRTELLELEPALNPSAVVGLRLPEKCQVRNPRHSKALIAALASAGVELLPGEPVTELVRDNGRIVAARTLNGEHVAGQFVVAAGAWSRRLLAACGAHVAVEPVRGQIVMLATQPLPFTHIIGLGARYLVPRPDGRVLVGATEEWVGYRKENTADAVAGLIRFAQDLVPGLAAARFERCWAGLRPGAGDGLPYLGPVPGNDNLFVATGHFRAGVQLSPGTAVLVRQMILGQDLMVPIENVCL